MMAPIATKGEKPADILKAPNKTATAADAAISRGNRKISPMTNPLAAIEA